MGAMPVMRGSFETQEWILEVPRVSDLPLLTALTGKLLGSAETASNGKNLKCLPDSAWRSLIAAQDVVCARTREGKLAGAYVTNHYAAVYGDDDLRKLRAAQSVLCNRFKIADVAVGFGAQAIIDLPWQASDLRAHLLRTLLRTVGLRYRHLFSFYKKDNPHEIRALSGDGWRCFHEEDDTCFVVLDVAKSLRLLASQLLLRVPTAKQPQAATSNIVFNSRA